MNTQCERILNYLEIAGTITAFEAMTELGIMRLASRINDLRKAGHLINSRMRDVTNRWGETCRVAEYSLVANPKKLDAVGMKVAEFPE